MLRLKGKKIYNTYQIAVTIIEAKHLMQNANPMVVVKVGNKKKRTIVRKRTDSPYYNEYFVFKYTGDFNIFLSTKISILVYLQKCLRFQFYGGIFFEVATVWEQPGHEYYHKWAIITNPKEQADGTRGYVKCNVSVNAKGERMRVHADSPGEDDIQGNLLMPILNYPKSNRKIAQYIFTIYRVDGLSTDDSSFLSYGNLQKTLNPYIQISFAGMKGKTNWYKGTKYTRYNEKIVFTEMYPPLFYRVKIAIKNKIDGCHSSTVATHTLNLAELLNYGEYGSLPTYGPSFIHFYRINHSNYECCCMYMCQGMHLIHCGRVLLSLKTEIDDSEASTAPKVDIEPTAPIIERKLWTTEEYLLVGIIYDVYMIDRCRFMKKSISFEITFGNVGSQISNNIENSINDLDEVVLDNRLHFENHTAPRLTTTTDGKFNYLPLGSNKPCMYIKCWWPNFEWRISNTNCLLYIANFLENNLTKLETLIAVKSENAYDNYNSIMTSLRDHCIYYLHILGSERYNINGGTTKLDRYRVNRCRECIENIIKTIKLNGDLSNNNNMKIAMIHAYNYLEKIRKIYKDPQHAFPDIFIWMLAGTKRVAFGRVMASEIIYAEDYLSRGIKCGQRVNLFMKNIDDDVYAGDYGACNIEIFFWLGNVKFSSACWSYIPAGYKVNNTISIESFPRTIDYTYSWKFQLRAHIFQGRFNCGLDSTGLMDPFIRIIFQGCTALTKSIKQSLAPVWDETLILPSISLYGTKESIKSQPPQVVVEAFDWNLYGSNKFYGRFVVKPVVKLMEETYSSPEFPPILIWHTFTSQKNFDGSILAAFELIETKDEVIGTSTTSLNERTIQHLPNDIRPIMRSHRFEIIFWGVRNMKKINGIRISKPRIVVECCGVHINSEIMENAKKFTNFHENHVIINLDLPEQHIYYPPLTIKAYDLRSFGYFKYVGYCIIPSSNIFLEELLTDEEYKSKIYKKSEIIQTHQEIIQQYESSVILPVPIHSMDNQENKILTENKKKKSIMIFYNISKILKFSKRLLRGSKNKHNQDEQNLQQKLYENTENENNDWWCKYFASLEEEKNQRFQNNKTHSVHQNSITTFKIYQSELETQPEFHHFQDKLTTFELSRSKICGVCDDNNNNYSGKFKGRIAIYPWPHAARRISKNGKNVNSGLLVNYPSPDSVKLLVRVYVIKGINLHPCDTFTGKSDPYLIIKLGRNYISDQKNYCPNQSNPIFGKCFEMKAFLPRDHTLIIQVWDHDTMTPDDMIGETKIDIENRYYSDHRGQCGISKTYNTSGYNLWRDCETPTQILQSLCIKNNLPLPEFSSTCVTIAKQKFLFNTSLEKTSEKDRRECMALNVLHQWQLYPISGITLVPEHIERRPLFNVEKPGLEQGKLELWVDMFRIDDFPPKPCVNITPQVPVDYELRVIIWNTRDVPLVDNQFITGEKCSDIYVKGWILYEDYQTTDVHYNSLNGEGNFNWRFIFRFTYTKSENLMVVRKKLSAFAMDETEEKLPCVLYVQVWDSDHFSSDDFLGSLTINLSRVPRGSANSKNCTLKVTHPNSPTINLFKAKSTKAWWPFKHTTEDAKDYSQAGKVEMELTLIPIADADMKPVGRGRDPPNPLPQPNRPDTSFSWFRNPWNACRFFICRYYRTRIMCFCSLFLLILLLGCGLYAFPGYLVKKLLGA